MIRPYLLGSRPSLADIGLSGPFFRHFALDPVPLEILRQTAPAVLEWVGRLWNSRPEDLRGEWCSTLPDDLLPLLSDIGAEYLPYLSANAQAVNRGHKRFDVQVNGIEYKKARYSQYRVWCLAQLRMRLLQLPEDTRKNHARFTRSPRLLVGTMAASSSALVAQSRDRFAFPGHDEDDRG